MDETTDSTKPIMPGRPPLPDGFWSLPGGHEGLCGSVEGVIRIISDLSVPEHDKTALLEKIKAETDEKPFNFVRVFAHQTRHATAAGSDTILNLRIQCSKINL